MPKLLPTNHNQALLFTHTPRAGGMGAQDWGAKAKDLGVWNAGHDGGCAGLGGLRGEARDSGRRPQRWWRRAPYCSTQT